MKSRTLIFVSAAAGIAFAGALGAFATIASAAGPAPAPAPAPCAVQGTPFLTLTQPITEPDSGNFGNWANDAFTENVSVWLATDGSGTFCASGNTTNGTFTTTGPDSPQAGAPLAAGINGTFTGGETWVFPAGTATTTSASSLTLAADNSATGSQFNNWQSSVFNAAGQNVGASTYSFTYVTPNNGTWTNADPTSGGNSGDITGSPVSSVTTEPATDITSSDATLNAMNGDVAATDSSFWVSTSTFSTASATVPSGVYSTPDLGAQASSSAFSAQLSSATGLPAVTPDTTYYFAAWISTDGGATWTPGSILSFTTLPAAATTTIPVISNIAVSDIGTSTATISWNTDVNSNGTVNYGTSTPYTMSASDAATSTTSHSVTLNNLAEATLYHFDVSSTDSAGTATSTDQEFTTTSTASTTPLAIDGITANQTNGIADDTFTDGWQWTIHFTVPTNEDAFRIRFSDWGNASNSFPTADNVQVYSPESSNASSPGSAILETGNGYSDWLYLTGDTASSTPGRQIDLVVQVKIPFGTPAGSYSSDFTAESYPSNATSTAI